MKMLTVIVPISLLLIATSSCKFNPGEKEQEEQGLQPFKTTLSPAQDTYLNANSDVNVNGTRLNLYTWPNYTRANTIVMKFNLPDLEGRTIKKATLNLYLVKATNGWCSDPSPESYRVDVNKLINFNPDLSVASGEFYDGVNPWTACTYCNNTTYSIADNDTEGPYDSKILDQTLEWKEWDITQMVQEWANDPDSNYGLAIFSDETKTQNCERGFASSEHADQDKHPYLTIDVE
ncbi:MAG: hypothetical protein CMJ16_05805 [Peredibacter sp.]|nr:hypothetical protein [Peredibacter sp.]